MYPRTQTPPLSQRRLVIVSISLSTIVFFAKATDAKYTVIDLHPSAFYGSAATGISNGQIVGYGGGPIAENTHALSWPRADPSAAVDLNPAGYVFSVINGISGGNRVGWGHGASNEHALLWPQSSSTPIDLHPAQFTYTFARSGYGDEQVGLSLNGRYGTGTHALVWHGSPSSVVDLHPTAGFKESAAFATNGAQQAGYGFTTGGQQHALLWSGTAASAIDLNPRDATSSIVTGLSHDLQMGSAGAIIGRSHATLWTGSAESAVDLHPAGFDSSGIFSTNGTVHVGSGIVAGTDVSHALVWNGTNPPLDLHQFLPPQFTSSMARGVDEFGHVVGVAFIGQRGHAVMWVPEPSATAAIAAGTMLTGLRRRARSRRPLRAD